MMRRLLFSKRNPGQLIISSIGSLAGFFLILFSVQGYLEFSRALTGKNDWLHPEYLIINKKLTIMSSFSPTNGFDESEINELKALPGIEQVLPFQNNRFRAAGMNLPGTIGANDDRYADLFFESIPDDVLDITENSFRWNIGDAVLPIIIPSDFLKLYNFGFAPSQGMPQVSQKTLSSIPFQIMMDSLGTRVYKEGRIVAFSQRIQSILVPESFLRYANHQFVHDQSTKAPTRLLIEVKDPLNDQLINHLRSHGYESNEEQLRNSRLSSALRIITALLAGIAALIILLSVLGFFQYGQLILLRNEYHIRTLLDLGMPAKRIFMQYFMHNAFIIFGIGVISVIIVAIAQGVISQHLENYGMNLGNGLHNEVIYAALIIFAFYLVVQAIGIQRGISRFLPKRNK